MGFLLAQKQILDVARKSQRNDMSPVHDMVFLFQKPCTENGLIRPTLLFRVWLSSHAGEAAYGQCPCRGRGARGPGCWRPSGRLRRGPYPSSASFADHASPYPMSTEGSVFRFVFARGSFLVERHTQSVVMFVSEWPQVFDLSMVVRIVSSREGECYSVFTVCERMIPVFSYIV